MDNQYYYNTHSASSIQKELSAKYQMASKELQNLYKRSTMIEPLLEMLEDIYSKEEEGAAIAPLSLSINQIKALNADIKTCLLNVKEKKSGPFQRIIKTKGENFDALENRMDKLIRDLEVALSNAEQVAKENSEKKKHDKKKAHNNNNNNNNNQVNKQKQNDHPTKYTLTDNSQNYYKQTENYNGNYIYNNNTSGYNYQEPANYGNYSSEQNNNNNFDDNNYSLNTSLTNEFAQMNIKLDEDISENKNEPKTETNDQSNYSSNQYTNGPTINIQPPNYHDSQNTYNNNNNYSNDQLYNNYPSPSQNDYYGTLSKSDQNKQSVNNYNQPVNNYNQPVNNYNQPINNYNQPVNNYNQPINNYNQPVNNYNQPINNYNQPVNNYNQPINNYNQPVNNYNQPINDGQDINNYNNIQGCCIYNPTYQPINVATTQISTSEATTMEGDSLINQKGLIPPTPYYAISSFTPRQPDELAIEQGDEVIIVQTFDDGWAFGRNSRTRMVGVLPMTFLSSNNQYGNNNNEYSNKLPVRQSSRRINE